MTILSKLSLLALHDRERVRKTDREKDKKKETKEAHFRQHNTPLKPYNSLASSFLTFSECSIL